jgi:hypothetical protein
MVRGAIQFQKGLSLSEFHRLYGSEENCEAALEKARWPDGFCWPRCAGHEHALVYGRCLNRYQCGSCDHQAALTTWFQAFYLIRQSKTGIS